jgi:hypothetical protein
LLASGVVFPVSFVERRRSRRRDPSTLDQKGTTFRSTLAAIEKLDGPLVLAKVKDRLPPALRELIEPRVLTVRWYPVALGAAIHLAVRDVIGAGRWDHSHALGVEASMMDFTGVYRVLLRAIQYDTIWSRMELTWGHSFTQGGFKWHDRREGYVKATIAGVTGFNRGIWNAAAGRGEGLLKLSGAKAASAQVIESTASDCTFEAMWLV